MAGYLVVVNLPNSIRKNPTIFPALSVYKLFSPFTSTLSLHKSLSSFHLTIFNIILSHSPGIQSLSIHYQACISLVPQTSIICKIGTPKQGRNVAHIPSCTHWTSTVCYRNFCYFEHDHLSDSGCHQLPH